MSAPSVNNILETQSLRGAPLVHMYPGRVFWVSNRTTNLEKNERPGANVARLGTFMSPFQTIAYAATQCVAGRGDVIMVKPGHAETISSSTSMTIATADVAIIGIGDGPSRPTITLGTATTATLNITAANVSLKNILFVANFAAIAAAITTTAKHTLIEECEFRDSSSVLNFVSTVTTGTTDNASDGLAISNSNIFGLGTTASTTMLSIKGNLDRLVVSGCYQQNLSTTDGGGTIIAAGTKVLTNMRMLNNILNLTSQSGATHGVVIATGATSNTGVLDSNYVHALGTTSQILVTASSGFVFFNNKYVHTADKSAFLLPASDS